MEEQNANVFASEVPMKRFKSANLYELIETTTVQPALQDKCVPENLSTLQNIKEKSYVSRKFCKRKVKTVQQIRQEYEQLILEYLPIDLELQHKYILDKICSGSFREDITIVKAQRLLKASCPVRRSSWQMLMNINAESVPHPKQCVIWKGNYIKLSGSKGGSKKKLYNLDIAIKAKGNVYKPVKKNGLLKTSLDVTFKPGPLTKKESLDVSFQKYTLGKTELMPLPRIGLEIDITCGVPLQPHLYGYLQNSREINGILTEDWIKFAVSSLENYDNDNIVTFKLNYKNNQKRILMRDNSSQESKHSLIQEPYAFKNVYVIENDRTEIKSILNDMIAAVEVNIMQDTLILDDCLNLDSIQEIHPNPQKGKPQNNLELKRLDVTILHVDGDTPVEEVTCSQLYCAMGCICPSLQCKIQLKNHCGQLDCMFDCKCNYKKYCINDAFEGCVSGLNNLDRKKYCNLSKEEQKFHQTVVFTEGKSIVLSSKRRNPRMTKKYADYIYSLTGKSKYQNKEMMLSLPRLDFSNIEPWCMVHELYRCFCKGRFLIGPSAISRIDKESNLSVIEDQNKSSAIHSNKTDINTCHKNENNKETASHYKSEDEEVDVLSEDNNIKSKKEEPVSNKHDRPDLVQYTTPTCSRTTPYLGRSKHPETSVKISKAPHIDENLNNQPSLINQSRQFKLGLWLEQQYKLLKDRMDAGFPIILEKPVPKRTTLFPWSELLKRYQLRHNYFLVHKTPPHRVFISVNPSHEEFSNCMNLSDINFEDLPKHSDFVKHFIMKTDLKENFAWLKGSQNYWEVLGIVTKNRDKTITQPKTSMGEITSTLTLLPDINETQHRLDTPSDTGTPPSLGPTPETCEKYTSSSLHTEEIDGTLLEPQTILTRKSNRKRKCENIKEKLMDQKTQQLIKIAPKGSNKIKKRDANRQLNSVSPQTEPGISREEGSRSCSIVSRRKQSLQMQKSSYSHDSSITQVETSNDTTNVNANINSRWFVMTVEHDFINLRFYNKKLFVKFETIMGAIDLARLWQQTVILPLSNTKVCNDNEVQYGIYATPFRDKACIFIGPYEKDEGLCIETVKGPNNTLSEKRTRGVWLIAKKVEDSKIVENPLSFLPNCSDDNIELTANKSENVAHISGNSCSAKDLECVLPYATQTSCDNIEVIRNQQSKKVGNVSEDNDKDEDLESKIFTNTIKRTNPAISLAKCKTLYENLKLQPHRDSAMKLQKDYHKPADKNISDTVLPSKKTDRDYSLKSLKEDCQNKFDVNEIDDSDQSHYVSHGGVILQANTVKIPPKTAKVIKPIRISRNNGFYQLASSALLKKVSLLKPVTVDSNTSTGTSIVTNPRTSNNLSSPTPCIPVITSFGSIIPQASLKKMSPEKLSNILKYQKDAESPQSKLLLNNSPMKTFTVLKPEQINNKALQFQNYLIEDSAGHLKEIEPSNQMTDESSSNSSSSSSSEIYILSDDESPSVKPSTAEDNSDTEIIIECINLRNLGCLRGRRNMERKISFQFPGFQFSEYCTEDETFDKINQVLSRKVYVPKSLRPQWRVVEADNSNDSYKLLSPDKLGPSFILTREGLIYKNVVKRLDMRNPKREK